MEAAVTGTMTTSSIALTQVDACTIERELARLWNIATEAAHPDEAALMRACLFNFVVLTEAAHLSRITGDVARLTALRPNRAIVVALSTSAIAQPMEAWVQAHCALIAPGQPHVCGEQITIVASRDTEAQIPGIVLSLLEPDVPVILWWSFDEVPGGSVLTQLQPVADRLIIDTAHLNGTAEAFRSVQTLIDAGVAIGDLAWGRVTVWREQIAQLFDAPPALQRLQSLERIVIEHSPRGLTTSLLLSGWIATRLNWRILERHDTGVRFARSGGGSVLVEFKGIFTEAASDLASVTLLASDAQFTVTRSLTGGHLASRAVINAFPPVERAVHLPALDTAALIVDELRLTRRDPIYEAALYQALDLAEYLAGYVSA